MNKKTVFFSIIFICLSLISCSENRKITISSYVPGSNAKIVVGNHEWYYIKSPTGRCYETTIRMEPYGTKGYGFFGMWRIPCDEMPEQQPTLDKSSEQEEPSCEN